MRYPRVVVYLGLLLLVPACTRVLVIGGSDFATEPIRTLSVGQTTKAQITSAFGVPRETKKRTLENLQYDTFEYLYSFVDETTSRVRVKRLTCEFRDGRLNAYEFNSTVPGEQVKFDDGIRRRLQQGQISRDEVTRLLGAPQTRALLPTTLLLPRQPPESKETWRYSYRSLLRPTDAELNQTKSLTLSFDAPGVLVGVSYLEEVEER